MRKYIDIIDQRFGRWVVLEFALIDKKNTAYWRCKCDCGEERVVSGTSLRRGSTKSCGCLRRENTSKSTRKHGLSESPLERTRNNMVQRCTNPNSTHYKHYGGRGIIVYEEWRRNPASFYKWAYDNGYEEYLTIERINNNGNYEPDNCRWATIQEQNNNQRSNKLLTYKGETKNLKQWSKDTGIKYATIYRRFIEEYPPEDILNNTKGVKNQNKSRPASIQQLCKEAGVCRQTVYRNLKRGVSIEESLVASKPKVNKFKEKIIFENKETTLEELARENNIRHPDITNRLSLGWSLEKIFSTPVKRYKKGE